MAGKYGKFTGYEPGPLPGSFLFGVDGGQPMLMGGQPAEDLRTRLDAYDAGTRVAGPGGGNPFDKSMQDLQGTGAKIAEQNREGLGLEPTPAAPSPPPQGDRPLILNEIDTGIKLTPGGRAYKEVAASRGVSQEQLQEKATQGVATPSSTSESTTGGFAPSQEFLEGRSEARNNERLALDRQRDAELQAEEAGRGAAMDQFVAATAQRDEQQRMANQIQAQVQQAQSVRDQALKDYTGSKVDPERLFIGGAGGVRKVLSALGAALGARSAAITGGPNFAQQIIDGRIAQDIAAQEADIRIKKDASDTALNDLMRRGMSLEQAKGTLGTIQRDWAKQQMALARGASNSEIINAKYDAAMAKLDQQALADDEDYRQKSLGTATKAVASQVKYPVAGSAGGRVYLTPEQATELAGKKTSLEGGVAGTAKTIGDIEAGGKKSQGDQKALATIATADEALKALDAYKDDEIAQIPENQNIVSRAYHGAKDIALGAGSSARGMDNRDRNLIQDTEAAKGYVKSLTSVLSGQGALSGPEAQTAERGLAPGATVGDLKRAVATVRARAQAILDAGGSVGQSPVAPVQQ